MVNTLYPCEIHEKLWPLPVDKKKKKNYGENDLAKYANGIDGSPVDSEDCDMRYK